MAEMTPEERLKAAQDQETLLKNRIKLLEEEGASEEKILDFKKQQRDATRELLLAKKEAGILDTEQLAAGLNGLDAKQAKLDKELDTQKKIKDAIEEQQKLQEDILDLVGSIGAKYENTLLDKIAESKVSIGQLGEAFKKNFSIDRITGAAFDAFTEQMAFTVAQAASARTEFARATGAGSSFDSVITDLSSGSRNLGVGFVEATQAINALHSNMSGFTSMNQQTQASLARTAAELESVGISADVTAAQMDYTTRVMGLSADQAREQAEGMKNFAMNAGIAPAKMAQEFTAAGPKLAQYGKDAGKVFQGLALQSKKLGIEMNDLLSITQQFDTFEGAANAAGQLNAVLGGPFLDSMELLTAETEEQRVAMLQNSLQMSGKSFDAMNKFEKMAVANAAGITDMSVAARMFGSASQQMAEEHKMLGLTQEEITARQEAGVSVMKKLEVAGQSLAVAVMPLVDIFSIMASGLASFVDFLGPVVPLLAVVASGIYVVRKAMLAMTVINTLAAAQEEAGIIRKTILAAKNFALGKSTEAVTDANKKMSNSNKTAGKSIGSLGRPLAMLGIGLIKVGLGVLAIGAGIGLAAAGVALLIYSFTNLLKVVIDNIAVMPQAVGSILNLAAAFLAFGVSIAIAGAGFMIFAAAFSVGVKLMAAMAPFAIVAAKALGFVSLGVAGLASSFGLLSLSFDSIADQVNDVISGMRALTGEDGVKQFVTVVKSIDEDNVGNLGKLIDEAERLVVVQTQLSALEATQAVGSAINKLISVVAPESAGGEAGKKEIVLQINDREFGRAVVEALDDDMKLSLA